MDISTVVNKIYQPRLERRQRIATNRFNTPPRVRTVDQDDVSNIDNYSIPEMTYLQTLKAKWDKWRYLRRRNSTFGPPTRQDIVLGRISKWWHRDRLNKRRKPMRVPYHKLPCLKEPNGDVRFHENLDPSLLRILNHRATNNG